MIEFLRLILHITASLFKPRTKLVAEILILRQQLNVLRRQVSFDAATGGRIEQSRVDQMHALTRLTILCLPASSGPALHILTRNAVKRMAAPGGVLHNIGLVQSSGTPRG